MGLDMSMQVDDPRVAKGILTGYQRMRGKGWSTIAISKGQPWNSGTHIGLVTFIINGFNIGARSSRCLTPRIQGVTRRPIRLWLRASRYRALPGRLSPGTHIRRGTSRSCGRRRFFWTISSQLTAPRRLRTTIRLRGETAPYRAGAFQCCSRTTGFTHHPSC